MKTMKLVCLAVLLLTVTTGITDLWGDTTPTTAEEFYNRGIIYAFKEEYDKAIADFTQAIRLNSNYADAYYARGLSYSDKGDYNKAIADYEAALKIKPNDAGPKRNLELARAERDRKNAPAAASAPSYTPSYTPMPMPNNTYTPTPSYPSTPTKIRCTTCVIPGKCKFCNGVYEKTCSSCGGTGTKLDMTYGSRYITCGTCDGKRTTKCTWCRNGICGTCNGTGYI